MQFYTGQHPYYCGIDRTRAIIAHRNMTSALELFLTFIASYRNNIVIGVECMFT